MKGRHIEHEDFRRLIDELSATRPLREDKAEGGAERLLEQLLKSLNRERRS
jgi:hypothetical protein